MLRVILQNQITKQLQWAIFCRTASLSPKNLLAKRKHPLIARQASAGMVLRQKFQLWMHASGKMPGNSLGKLKKTQMGSALEKLIGFYKKSPQFMAKYKTNTSHLKQPNKLQYLDLFGHLCFFLFTWRSWRSSCQVLFDLTSLQKQLSKEKLLGLSWPQEKGTGKKVPQTKHLIIDSY